MKMTITLQVTIEADVDPRVHAMRSSEQWSVAESVECAITDALKAHEAMGFNHPLEDYVTLEIADVRVAEGGCNAG
jgi:hypothetical protein